MAKDRNKNKTTEEPKAKVLTPEEAAISSRIESESTDWFDITEDDINDFSLMANPLDLQPEAQKLQDEKVCAFRFCERTAKRVDTLTRSVAPPLRWAIVNKTTLPVMGKYVDDILGCVCVLDQMLLFKPWNHHAIVQKAKLDLAENLDVSGQLEALAAKAPDGVEIMVGTDYKIGSRDEVQYEDDADAGDTADLGDLVVAE